MYSHSIAVSKRLDQLLGRAHQVDIVDEKFMDGLQVNMMYEFKTKMRERVYKRIGQQDDRDKMLDASGFGISKMDKEYESKGKTDKKLRLLKQIMPIITVGIEKEAYQSEAERERAHQELLAYCALIEKEPEKSKIQKEIEDKIRGGDSVYAKYKIPLLYEMGDDKTIEDLHSIADRVVWRRDILEGKVFSKEIMDALAKASPQKMEIEPPSEETSESESSSKISSYSGSAVGENDKPEKISEAGKTAGDDKEQPSVEGAVTAEIIQHKEEGKTEPSAEAEAIVVESSEDSRKRLRSREMYLPDNAPEAVGQVVSTQGEQRKERIAKPEDAVSSAEMKSEGERKKTIQAEKDKILKPTETQFTPSDKTSIDLKHDEMEDTCQIGEEITLKLDQVQKSPEELSIEQTHGELQTMKAEANKEQMIEEKEIVRLDVVQPKKSTGKLSIEDSQEKRHETEDAKDVRQTKTEISKEQTSQLEEQDAVHLDEIKEKQSEKLSVEEKREIGQKQSGKTEYTAEIEEMSPGLLSDEEILEHYALEEEIEEVQHEDMELKEEQAEEGFFLESESEQRTDEAIKEDEGEIEPSRLGEEKKASYSEYQNDETEADLLYEEYLQGDNSVDEEEYTSKSETASQNFQDEEETQTQHELSQEEEVETAQAEISLENDMPEKSQAEDDILKDIYLETDNAPQEKPIETVDKREFQAEDEVTQQPIRETDTFEEDYVPENKIKEESHTEEVAETQLEQRSMLSIQEGSSLDVQVTEEETEKIPTPEL